MIPPAPRGPGTDTEVLIAGAGPTGLVLALWLARLGVRVRIIDKTSQPGTTSRALAVQARTLEFYAQLGLADAIVERGRQVEAINLWVTGDHVTRAVFGKLGTGISPFPFALVFPQDEHERLLIDELASLGVRIERQTELLRFEEASGHILAHFKLPDGAEQSCRAAFLAGCDGAHSIVRQSLNIGFPGGEYTHLFYVADVDASGPVANGELHVGLDKADFLAVFPLKAEGRLRLVGTIRDAQQKDAQLSWDDVSKKVLGWIRVDVRQVNWFSTYRVHHRVAERFRSGRAFLLGDAAHIHSPVGGQGMNTGIGDAVNLAWKLAAVLRHHAPESILDTYEPERIAFARRLVATTDKAFVAVTSPTALARFVRLRLVPLILPAFFSVAFSRRYLFRTVSQTVIHYRRSSLSQGRGGAVHGGDRLPWVRSASNQALGNFAPLTSLDWQVHVYGDASPGLRSICAQRKLALHIFPWHREMTQAHLRPNALYLIRPDGYIALADPEASVATLTTYLDTRGLVA